MNKDQRDINGIGWVEIELWGGQYFVWANPEFADRPIPDGYVWGQLACDAPYRIWKLV